MVQGTTSDAGKSVLVAGLCRVLSRKGVKVAPFKPQNMALNSAVTTDGGEIGRAQAVQAQACGIEPRIDMNPVLLKPNSDTGAQVIIQGHAVTEMDAVSYHGYKATAMEAVLDSFDRLQSEFQVVMVEGAGSPAEVNLRDNDIANMGFAERVDSPVILVADIDRGGVFAHLVGTLELLSPTEQERVVGFVINRFRGDVSILQPGLDWLEQRTGKPVLGVVPYLHGFHLEAEDAVAGQQELDNKAKTLKVVVPVVKRISNHTDFDALRLHPQVDLQFIPAGEEIPGADLIILPGTKSTRSDLRWLREQGWDKAVYKHLRYGGKVIGICGGFQMLGNCVADPEGIEGPAGSSEGLGLLDMETVLEPEKQLRRESGQLAFPDPTSAAAGRRVEGYEIHAGVTQGPALNHPAVKLQDRTDGAVSEDGQILGTYLHGLFDHSEAFETLLKWAGLEQVQCIDYRARQEADIERLADALEMHLDLEKVYDVLNVNDALTEGAL